MGFICHPERCEGSLWGAIQRLHLRITGTRGTKRNALAFFAGILMTLTLPPVFALPLIIPAFTILFVLVDAAPTSKRAFGDGWWWGMGWHVTGLYWFCIALLTDPEKFAWLIPFCLIGLNAIIALYAGIACWLWKKSRVRGLSGILLFSIIWTLVEFARGHLFTGFPWNLAGYVFTAHDTLLQMASLVGVYGLTWFAVILGVIPAAIFYGRTRRAWFVIVLTYSALILGAGWGAWRLANAENIESGTRLRLVQPNIQQNLRWDPAHRRQVLDEHIKLTRLPGIENIDVVIWPETAAPYAIRSEDVIAKLMGGAIGKNAHLVLGGLRVDGDEKNWQIYNSMLVLNHNGTIVTYYDKARLVPFGEFIPLRKWLPRSLLMPAGDKDFSIGRSGVTLQIPSEKQAFLPLICYEVIFPEMLEVDASFAAPTWMLNITNDAWFGNSSGPYQHFHMARMRAVEQGLPLVRVANTGISAVVDAYGRILSKMGLGISSAIDIELPKANQLTNKLFSLENKALMVLIITGLMLTIGQYMPKNN